MLKKIDKLLIISFWPPFIVTFFIALFVFIMVFLWTYIDEIIGKGADIFMLSELMFYLSVSLVPRCLPIAVLISSIMVLGNLAERYELTSIKSAGVPLLRTMKPLMIVAFGISIFSFICADKIIPVANLQFKTRLYDIRRNKPTLNLEEGVFNYDFKDFVMYIGEKGEDDRTIKDVLIYDHSSYNKKTYPRILAKEGEMYTSQDGAYFIMKLRNGTQYSEVAQANDKEKTYPFMRVEFEEWTKVFDLAQFDIDGSDKRSYTKHYAMLSCQQLLTALDSIDISVHNKNAAISNITVKSFKPLNDKLKQTYREMPRQKKLDSDLSKDYGQKNGPNKKKAPAGKSVDSKKEKSKKDLQDVKKKNIDKKDRKKKSKAIPKKPITAGPKKKKVRKKTNGEKKLAEIEKRSSPPAKRNLPPEQTVNDSLLNAGSFVALFNEKDQKTILARAKSNAKNMGSQISASIKSLHRIQENEVKHVFELHNKFTMALICFFFLFIGAPLGAIIRKGGFGFPILIAIIFYVLFEVLLIFSKKVAESLVFDPIFLAWLPIIVIFPIGIFLTNRAMQDRKVVDFDLLIQKVTALFKRGTKDKTDGPTKTLSTDL